MPEITFTFDGGMTLQLVLTVVLPVLVGLVTKRVTSASTKAILLAGLSVVSSLLTEILSAAEAGTAYDLGRGLTAALFTFVGAVALHYGLFKPTGVSKAAQNALGGRPAAEGGAVGDDPRH